jgi:hypothetical protein
MHGHLGAVAGRLIILRLERRLDKGALRRQNHSKPLQHPQRTDKNEPPESGSFFLFYSCRLPEAVGVAFARTLQLNPNLRGETPMKIVLALKKMRAQSGQTSGRALMGSVPRLPSRSFFLLNSASRNKEFDPHRGGIQFTG